VIGFQGDAAAAPPEETCVLSLVGSSPVAAKATYNPYSPALAPELGRAYAAQRRQPVTDGEERLRDITFALVRRLKHDGLPPERVIVAVKMAIVRYGDDHRPPSLAAGDESQVQGGELYLRLFQWILDAYFATD
jgi:hypothetical protein